MVKTDNGVELNDAIWVHSGCTSLSTCVCLFVGFVDRCTDW